MQQQLKKQILLIFLKIIIKIITPMFIVVHYLSGLATDRLKPEKLCKNINAQHAHEIIFTKTTDSINLVTSCFESILNNGDEIIISELEHHSNIVPWQLCCEQSGAKLKVIPLKENGELDINKFETLLSSKTKLVAVSHVSNSLGTINPVRKIINLLLVL